MTPLDYSSGQKIDRYQGRGVVLHVQEEVLWRDCQESQSLRLQYLFKLKG